ncbi:MAG: chromate transporter [Phascolarctobacterium faecium]
MDTSRPRYLHMFLVFVKIGLFTIGGGPAMIPLIRDEFVEKQKWIRDEDITDVLALSQSLPGVCRQCFYLSWLQAGDLKDHW